MIDRPSYMRCHKHTKMIQTHSSCILFSATWDITYSLVFSLFYATDPTHTICSMLFCMKSFRSTICEINYLSGVMATFSFDGLDLREKKNIWSRKIYSSSARGYKYITNYWIENSPQIFFFFRLGYENSCRKTSEEEKREQTFNYKKMRALWNYYVIRTSFKTEKKFCIYMNMKFMGWKKARNTIIYILLY